MQPRKIFENLLTVLAILVLFEQFSSEACSYFWPLTLSASSNICDEFCSQFRLCVLKVTKAYCCEEVRNYGKHLSSKALLTRAGGGDASPTSPLDPPLQNRPFFEVLGLL